MVGRDSKMTIIAKKCPKTPPKGRRLRHATPKRFFLNSGGVTHLPPGDSLRSILGVIHRPAEDAPRFPTKQPSRLASPNGTRSTSAPELTQIVSDVRLLGISSTERASGNEVNQPGHQSHSGNRSGASRVFVWSRHLEGQRNSGRQRGVRCGSHLLPICAAPNRQRNGTVPRAVPG